MDLFEAKSDRGLERRVDEGDLRNLYRAGFLHLDSPVRRTGSPNWFRVEEIFPHFEKIPTGKKYAANLKSHSKKGLGKALFVVVAILLIIAALLYFSQRLARNSSQTEKPRAHLIATLMPEMV